VGQQHRQRLSRNYYLKRAIASLTSRILTIRAFFARLSGLKRRIIRDHPSAVEHNPAAIGQQNRTADSSDGLE
jgi:hypothetical protein